MARYTGPRLRKLRRLLAHLPGLTRKTTESRPYPPGEHGAAHRRQRASDYALRLAEKQKLKVNYGLSERQMRGYFKRAASMRGDTGHNLLALLESRLDNVVFRAGYAPTIPAARQLVRHGHVLVNRRRVDVPGQPLRPGDVVSLAERSRRNPLVVQSFATPALRPPSYVERDEERLEAKLTALPAREDVPFEIQENLVVEHYSRVA